jgi:hypothetical protein
VDWWFAFKFNAATFPGTVKSSKDKTGLFGGSLQGYDDQAKDAKKFSQAYAVASSRDPSLRLGTGSLGTTLDDPLGATFGQIYFGEDYYVLWNDQFHGSPLPTKSGAFGHSKGLLAWNDAGEGFVLQVSTPSWPASGNRRHPRQHDGNTLGYIEDDDIEVSQHFFALKINHKDLLCILGALRHAHVVTSLDHPQLVNCGGPVDVQAAVQALAEQPEGNDVTVETLSSGVQLICKPAKMAVPPWQLVSAQLRGADLRVASWWEAPTIPSTKKGAKIGCWDASLGTPGAVEIATTGSWDSNPIGLKGGAGPDHNHAKLGVSQDAKKALCIFGDMNQQGALSGKERSTGCSSSQNGRGGLFYVLKHAELWRELSGLLKGESAPTSK